MILQKLDLIGSDLYALSKTATAHDGHGLVRRENVKIMNTNPRLASHTAHITAYEDKAGTLWATIEHAHACLMHQ